MTDKVNLAMTEPKTEKPLLERFFFISEDNYLIITNKSSELSLTVHFLSVADAALVVPVLSTESHKIISDGLVVSGTLANVPEIAFALSRVSTCAARIYAPFEDPPSEVINL